MSSGGKKKAKTTSTFEPPSYLQGAYQDIANAAGEQYASGNNINPYTSLDMQFNRAADVTRTRLDSEFAGSGRNLGASQPARSDELQGLAARIYDPQNIARFDPLNQYIDRIAALTPGAGGTQTSIQPYFKSGLF